MDSQFAFPGRVGEASALGLESWPEEAVGVVSVPKWTCDCCFICSSWKHVQKRHPAWDKDIWWGGVCSTGPESLDEYTRLPSVPPEGSFRIQPPLVAGRLDLHKCRGDIDICIRMWEVILRREASPHIPSERLPGVLLSDTRGRKMPTDGQGWDFSCCPSPDPWQGVSPVG